MGPLEQAMLERAKREKARRAAGHKADTTFMGRLKDNVMGVDDGVMSVGEKVATALNMGGEGLTLGLAGDEVAAAADALVGRGTYDNRLAKYRGDERQFSEENPKTALASQILPGLAVPGLGVAKGAGLLGKVGMGALSGGVGAGLFGFMEGEGFDDRKADATRSAILGGALGAAAPLAGRVISNTVDNVRGSRALKQAAKSAPTRDQIESQASALFNSTKSAQIPRQPLQAASQRITANAVNGGMDSMLTPTAARVASNIDEVANKPSPTMSLQEMNILRRQAQVPAGNVANRTEKAVGTGMIKAIDDYVDAVAPQLGSEGKIARKMWSTLRKMDQMDEITARAQHAASGFENGLKAEFRKILKSEKLRRGYSKAELGAMAKVVNPGVLQNIVRQVGRLGVSLDNGSNALGGALGAGLGGSLLGGAGAVITPLIGTASRKASEMITARNAQRVGDVIRTPNVQLPALSNQARGLLDDLLVKAGRGGGLLAGQN